ncbi:MAG: hypothetical protein N2053_10880, partial [Chitinispirillaceae bacterium]|nr:hypothetical protein [Chitinispirillaceae bacterium]
MSKVKRIFVEKKEGFDIAAQKMLKDIRENLRITTLKRVRIINRYDIEGISDEIYNAARNTILSEPPVDIVYDENLVVPEGSRIFAVEYLPGQYDQRADSTAQCIQLITHGEIPKVVT